MTTLFAFSVMATARPPAPIRGLRRKLFARACRSSRTTPPSPWRDASFSSSRPDTERDKIVFRGAQGFLVPGYLEIPKACQRPCPVVLLLHGWSGSKENWYEDDNIISGGVMRKALLQEGYAALALDAATHGERSNEIDYQHVNPFDDPRLRRGATSPSPRSRCRP